MTLEKAIEILTDLKLRSGFILTIEGTDALKLGIEALKHFKILREAGDTARDYLLPGEE